MEVKKGVSKGVVIIGLIIVLLVTGVVGGAFYVYYSSPEEVYQENVEGGKLSLTYSDDQNLFLIENAIPTSDLVGTVYDSADMFFDFTVNVDIDEANFVEYEILLVKDETVSTALNNNIKVYLEKEENNNYVKVAEPEIFSSNVEDEKIGSSVMSIYKMKHSSNANDNYRLRMWLCDSAVVSPGQVQNYGVKVALRGMAK